MESEREERGKDPVVGTSIGESDVGAGAGGTGDAEDTVDIDVAEFARGTAEHGSEAGLAGGQGDLGDGGDLAGDFGGLDEEGDEGTPP